MSFLQVQVYPDNACVCHMIVKNKISYSISFYFQWMFQWKIYGTILTDLGCSSDLMWSDANYKENLKIALWNIQEWLLCVCFGPEPMDYNPRWVTLSGEGSPWQPPQQAPPPFLWTADFIPVCRQSRPLGGTDAVSGENQDLCVTVCGCRICCRVHWERHHLILN